MRKWHTEKSLSQPAVAGNYQQLFVTELSQVRRVKKSPESSERRIVPCVREKSVSHDDTRTFGSAFHTWMCKNMNSIYCATFACNKALLQTAPVAALRIIRNFFFFYSLWVYSSGRFILNFLSVVVV